MSEKKELICAYTRAQAIEKGILVDVSNTAWEARINWPVALTRTVWVLYVEGPEGADRKDEAGRLWDVLFMLAEELSSSTAQVGSTLFYDLYFKSGNREPRRV